MVLDTVINDVCKASASCALKIVRKNQPVFYCEQSTRRDIKELDCPNLGDLIPDVSFTVNYCHGTNRNPQHISYKVEFYEMRKIGLFKELK